MKAVVGLLAWLLATTALAQENPADLTPPPATGNPIREAAPPATRERRTPPPAHEPAPIDPESPLALTDPTAPVPSARPVLPESTDDRGLGTQGEDDGQEEEEDDEEDLSDDGEGDAPRRSLRAALGYSRYRMVDGFGGGVVQALFFSGFLPTGALRISATSEFGIRDYALGPADTVIRGSLLVGYQHRWGLGPVVPYGGAVATAGLTLGKRFRTNFSDTLAGGGLEIGLDVRLGGALFLGAGFSYLRVGFGGRGYDLFAIALRIGL